MSEGFEMRPTGQQTMSQAECDRFLRDAREAPKTKNPVILGIRLHEMMRSKNNGYPKDMYHAELEMRQAYKEEEETALVAMGYQEKYILKTHPKYVFRRNMADKFAERMEVASPTIINNAFVEERLVKTAEDEKKLKAQKPPVGCGPWVDRLDEIAPLPEAEYVDPNEEIARLRGALEQANRALDSKGGSGKRKEEPVTA